MGLTVVVGQGAVGRTLVLAEERAGRDVFVLDRGEDTLGRVPELVLLAVPEDAIAVAARETAAPIVGPGTLVAHLNGALGPEALTAAQERGALIVAMHPVMQFEGTIIDVERLRDARVSLAGSDEARAAAQRVVERWGATPVVIPDRADRANYHLALALASSHVAALLGWAEELLGPFFGLSAREVAADMAAHAVEMVRVRGANQALTGAVARGDVATVERHLEALPPSQRARYAGLLETVIAIAVKHRRLGPQAAEDLRALSARHR